MSWISSVFEVLLLEGEEACMHLLTAMNPAVGQQLIELVEGPVSAVEALSYAGVLYEIGQEGCALEILAAVLAPIAALN